MKHLFSSTARSFLFILALTLATTQRSDAKNIAILTCEDLQQAALTANADDTLVFAPGTFDCAVTFTKPVKLVKSVTDADATLSGVVKLKGAGTNHIQNLKFNNQVQISCTGVVSVVKCGFVKELYCTNATFLSQSTTFKAPIAVDLTSGSFTNFESYDSTFDSVGISGGKALFKRCYVVNYNAQNTDPDYFGIDLSNTAFEGIRLTNQFGIRSRSATLTPFTLVQSYLGYNQGGDSGNLTISSNRVWLGYNRIFGRISTSYCDEIWQGNIVFTHQRLSFAAQAASSTVKAFNNLFVSNASYTVRLYSLINGAEFINNTVFNVPNQSALYTDAGDFRLVLKGNSFNGGVGGNPGPRWDISYCVFKPATTVGLPIGGCMGCDSGMVNPDMTFQPSSFFLKTNSVCLNAGPPEPVYSDRDGSRNDIGFTGGPGYNPSNYTNTNPMVYFVAGSPLMFPQGYTNKISISAGAVSGD